MVLIELTAMDRMEVQKMRQARVRTDLLVMLLSKPCQFLSEIPPDWAHCVHCDMLGSEEWLDPEREIRPALENLVGHLASTGRIPIDYCAVKNGEVRSIVIKTEAEA
jgi:hypothetical protein